MTMKEIELDIVHDFEELDDKMNQYTFLLSYANQKKPYPKEYQTDEYLVEDCQVKTWVCPFWDGEHFFLYTDSESFILKAILGLLSEIYEGRTKKEIENYKFGLLAHDCIAQHITIMQAKGVGKILESIRERR